MEAAQPVWHCCAIDKLKIVEKFRLRNVKKQNKELGLGLPEEAQGYGKSRAKETLFIQ